MDHILLILVLITEIIFLYALYCSIFRRQLAAKGLQEDFTVTRDAPLVVLGDRALLDEVGNTVVEYKSL